MSRSVSVPYEAEVVAYAVFDDNDFDFVWEDAVYDLQSYAKSLYPSLNECKKWVGREDCAVLENKFAYIGVSCYGTLVAVWAMPKEENILGALWCHKVAIEKLAGCFGRVLRKVGSASNGEAFFQPVDDGPRGSMGLGFTSKEGWL